jgi:hypothetical protein
VKHDFPASRYVACDHGPTASCRFHH